MMERVQQLVAGAGMRRSQAEGGDGLASLVAGVLTGV